jgi:hypothetical protein
MRLHRFWFLAAVSMFTKHRPFFLRSVPRFGPGPIGEFTHPPQQEILIFFLGCLNLPIWCI